MLIRGTPEAIAPPLNPMGFSGLTLSGGLGYVDTTPLPAYNGASQWDRFRRNLFFGDEANKNAPGHFANIFGSYYDPTSWGAGNVAGHQRDLMGHWKRVLAMFPGATWDDIALAYGVSLSTIEDFARSANASAFSIVRAAWTNPFVSDDIKRAALGLIVRRFDLTPFEWASVIGMDEATAAQIVAVPVPPVAATSYKGVTPAVQATASAPGFIVDTRSGAIGVIPAGSEPFIDAASSPGDNVGGTVGFILTYPGDQIINIASNQPPINVPITPALWAQVKDLFNKHRDQPFEGFDRRIAGIAQTNGWSEEDLASILGLTVPTLRRFIDFRGGVMNIPEAREVITVTELPELTAPAEEALAPVELVFYFDFPVGFVESSATQKAAFYLAKLDAGFTDAQIRITTESAFGPQLDADWQALRNIAAAQRAAQIAAKAADDAAAAAAAAQAQADQVAQNDPQSSAAAVTAQQADNAATAAATADSAAAVAANAADTAAAAADAGDAAGSVQASQVAQTAADTATNAADAAAAAAERKRYMEEAVFPMAPRGGLVDLPGGGFYEPERLTTEQKVARYRELRAKGMTDAQIRAETEAIYGPQADADWAMLRSLAEPVTQQPAAGAGIAPLLLAVAAAAILGG
jgi:hypothetical protein